MTGTVDKYLVEKYARYLRWSIGLGIATMLCAIGLIASAIMYNYWERIRLNATDEKPCDAFCLDSGAVSLSFIMVSGICLLTVAPVAIYCLCKLASLRRQIRQCATREAAMTARDIVNHVRSV
ncbi:hypothetical protein F-S17_0017 [Faustovirus]|nr:hypothetical protein F-S17_0017 [Faustovirus]